MCSSDQSFFLLPRWTKEELKKVIAMLQNPEFDSKDIDPDLHKRMDKAVLDGRIKCFNMRESNADGDQDLNLYMYILLIYVLIHVHALSIYVHT